MVTGFSNKFLKKSTNFDLKKKKKKKKLLCWLENKISWLVAFLGTSCTLSNYLHVIDMYFYYQQILMYDFIYNFFYFSGVQTCDSS